MKRVLIVAVLALAAGGCGATEASDTTAVSSEPAAASPPDEPPPSVELGPPPAWVETDGDSTWLAYASYCWGDGSRHVCADAAAPECGDGRTPDVLVERGASLTFHLGFEPEQVSLMANADRPDSQPVRLSPTRTPTWVAEHPGAVSLFAQPVGDGDASYVACIRFEGEPAASDPLTVEEVLAAGFTGEPILVEGSLYVEGGVSRLCSGFRESYPPQCVEPSLVLEGLVLASAEGLQQASGIRWSDAPFRVRGEMRDDGRLEVLSTEN